MPEKTVAPHMYRASFFILRTPLLPLELFKNWGTELPPRCHDPLDSAAHPDKLPEYAQRLLSRPEVKEAIFLASPSLYARYYERSDESAPLAGSKLIASLIRYLVRITTRCTPLGLCAGISVGEIGGSHTDIQISDISEYKRCTRLGVRLLEQVAEAVRGTLAPHEGLRYIANNTCYDVNNLVRYMYWTVGEEGRRYLLGTAHSRDELTFVLERARQAISLGELTVVLCNQFPSMSQHTARQFVNSMIAAGLLLPEWMVRITGDDDPVRSLAAVFFKNSATAHLANLLETLRSDLDALDRHGITGDIGAYHTVRRKLETLPINLNPSTTFRSDLFKPLRHGQLARHTVDEALRCILDCQKLAPTQPHSRELQELVERFERRFGQTEVPLALAVDDECAELLTDVDRHTSPLLDDMEFRPRSSSKTIPWSTTDAALMRKLSFAVAARETEISIDDVLQQLPEAELASLPASFCARLSLLPIKADGRNYTVALHSLAGPSGVAQLSRFSYINESLRDKIQEHVNDEHAAYPDQVLAEVVHVPSMPRAAENVLLRPVLRGFEIPYAASSGAEPDRQLLIKDLFLSLRDGRFILRSAILNREILPRLTTPHNFSRPECLRLYRLLGLLQHQHRYWRGFRWSKAFDNAPYLPRVRAGSVIISLARWRINRREIHTSQRPRTNEFLKKIAQLRSVYKIPRFVSIGTADRLLGVDLDNPFSAANLVTMAPSESDIVLTEAPQLNASSCVLGSNGSFCNEIILPFVRAHGQLREPAGSARGKSSYVRTVFHAYPPGTEWLYLKVYCTAGSADRILMETDRQILAESLQRGWVDRWFFLRYRDPDFHLRLRFHGERQHLLADLLPRLTEHLNALLKTECVSRTELCTYQPEVSRYGGELAHQVCERLFYLDSTMVTELLRILVRDTSRRLQWHAAFLSAHQILDSFGFGVLWSQRVVRRLAEGQSITFEINSALRSQVSAKFRANRAVLHSAILNGTVEDPVLQDCIRAIAGKRDEYRALLTKLLAHFPTERDHPRVLRIASRLVHLHVNRLFVTKPLESEYVLCEFLAKTYQSMQARSAQ